MNDVANSCGDLFINIGYQHILRIRWHRLWAGQVRVLARGSVLMGMGSEIDLVIASFLFRG